jgi:hypothetical protein
MNVFMRFFYICRQNLINSSSFFFCNTTSNNTGWATITVSVGNKKIYIQFSRLNCTYFGLFFWHYWQLVYISNLNVLVFVIFLVGTWHKSHQKSPEFIANSIITCYSHGRKEFVVFFDLSSKLSLLSRCNYS